MSVCMTEMPAAAPRFRSCPVYEITYRPIPGLAGYYLGSDQSCWTTKVRGRPAKRVPSGPQWRQVQPDRTKPRFLLLWDGVKTRRLNLDIVFPAVFPDMANPELN